MNEIISRLVDPDDRSVLELVGEKDKKYVFKQIYVTQKDDQVYCVVRPITKISGISPDEAWVMQANSDNTLTIIENKQISNSVFAQYYQAIDSGKTEKGSVLKDEGLYTDPSSKSFSKFTELKLQADFKPIQKLDQAFHAVKGQDFACQSVKEYLFSVLHRFCSKGVAGCILFAGAPSTGKTMMGELIAQSLQRPFLRLDMSEYAHRESFIDLIGVNPCYKEAAQGVLTSFVNEHPVSVILLDEIEKAHENVMRIFLQVFDR